MLAGITNANVIVDPHGELGPADEHRIPFTLSEADYGVDVFLLCPVPQYVDFALETPDGSRIDPGNPGSFGTVERVTRGAMTLYRASLPAIPADSSGSHGGTWNAVLSIGRRWLESELAGSFATAQATGGRRVLPYDLLVHAYSNLVFAARAVQTSCEPGARAEVSATL